MTNTRGKVVLLRHGQTQWSHIGRHTGRTDIPLTPLGEEQARAAARNIQGIEYAQIFSSPLIRAQRTAQLAGFDDYLPEAHLAEWDYGMVEGHTKAEVSAALGRRWQIWDDGVHLDGVHLPAVENPIDNDGQPLTVAQLPGETIEQVAYRAQQLIDRITPTIDAGHNVLLVAHGHMLRIFAATWLGKNPRFARQIYLDTAAVCFLGVYDNQRAILQWNIKPQL